MKKLVSLIVLAWITSSAFSQTTQSGAGSRFRLNVYSAYVFDDKFDSYYDPYNYYNGHINGGYQWGLGAEFMVQPRYCVEFMWQHQSTHAPTYYWDGASTLHEKYVDFKLNLDYFLIGGEGHVQAPHSKVEGYGGLFLGLAAIGLDNPDNGNHNSTSKFAWGARLGANVWATDRIAIKLQAQLLSIAQGAGGGLYFGTGGAGVGLSTYSSIYQFGLGGGLSFKLGH